MKNKEGNSEIALQRLTALWALTESGLGGFLHAFRTPFSGLILAGIAMLLITLICYYSQNRWKDITKALIIVLIIKMLVSPHSMISAYLAVCFQGILGGLLYHFFGVNLITMVLLTTLGMIESAIQKVISLTLIYGKSLWEAIDTFGIWIGDNFQYILPFQTSKILISTYLTIYFISGILIGYFIHRLIRKIRNSATPGKFEIEFAKLEMDVSKSKRGKKSLVVFLAILIFIVVLTYFTGQDGNQVSKAVYIMTRTLLILSIWFILIAPFLLKILKRFLNKKKSELTSEVDQVFNIIPYLRSIINYSWRQSKGKNLIYKIVDFFYLSLMYSLHFRIPDHE